LVASAESVEQTNNAISWSMIIILVCTAGTALGYVYAQRQFMRGEVAPHQANCDNNILSLVVIIVFVVK
jgi:hypothetical protein